MALYFLETSALVKLYVQEPGTDRLLSLMSDQLGSRFVVLALSAVEARSAIRRRQRAGDIAREIANILLKDLQKHLETTFLRQAINDLVLDSASEMIDRYPLRAYDAIQLAGCLTLRAIESIAPTFVCSDHHLLDAAKSEGLSVLDPAAV